MQSTKRETFMFSDTIGLETIPQVVAAIKARGYVAIARALKEEVVRAILDEVGPLEFSFNRNDVPSVFFKNQRVSDALSGPLKEYLRAHDF